MKILRADLPSAFWAAAVFFAAVWILDPIRDFPLQDDWAYFLSVKHLVDDASLRVLDYTSASLIFQSLWGAMFSMVLGLSHSTLRLSTLFLAFLAMFLMGEFFPDEPRKIHPILSPPFLLTANPLFFLLSFTFLTDVPHLALTLAALALGRRAEKTDRPVWWAACSAAASLAYLVRQIGVLIPVGLALHLLLRGKLTPKRGVLLLALPAATLAVHQYWFHFIHGSTLTFEIYRQATSAGLAEPLKLAWNLYFRSGAGVLYCALFSVPQLLALNADGFRAPSRGAALGAAGLLAPLLLGSEPLFNMGIIYPGGLGSPDISAMSAKAGGVLAAAWFRPALVAAAAAAIFGWLGRWPELKAAWKDEGVAVMRLPCLLQFAAMLPGAIYTDRYMLPIVPLAVVWGCQALRHSRAGGSASSLAALLAGAAMFAWSLAGTWDYLNWNDAKWAAGRAAVRLGIPAERIFNGLDWCGFHVYEANMRRLKAAKPLERIGYWEWLTSQRFDYAVSFSDSRTAGPEVLGVSYWTPLSRAPGRISVKRLAPGAVLP